MHRDAFSTNLDEGSATTAHIQIRPDLPDDGRVRPCTRRAAEQATADACANHRAASIAADDLRRPMSYKAAASCGSVCINDRPLMDSLPCCQCYGRVQPRAETCTRSTFDGRQTPGRQRGGHSGPAAGSKALAPQAARKFDRRLSTRIAFGPSGSQGVPRRKSPGRTKVPGRCRWSAATSGK